MVDTYGNELIPNFKIDVILDYFSLVSINLVKGVEIMDIEARRCVLPQLIFFNSVFRDLWDMRSFVGGKKHLGSVWDSYRPLIMTICKKMMPRLVNMLQISRNFEASLREEFRFLAISVTASSLIFQEANQTDLNTPNNSSNTETYNEIVSMVIEDLLFDEDSFETIPKKIEVISIIKNWLEVPSGQYLGDFNKWSISESQSDCIQDLIFSILESTNNTINSPDFNEDQTELLISLSQILSQLDLVMNSEEVLLFSKQCLIFCLKNNLQKEVRQHLISSSFYVALTALYQRDYMTAQSLVARSKTLESEYFSQSRKQLSSLIDNNFIKLLITSKKYSALKVKIDLLSGLILGTLKFHDIKLKSTKKNGDENNPAINFVSIGLVENGLDLCYLLLSKSFSIQQGSIRSEEILEIRELCLLVKELSVVTYKNEIQGMQKLELSNQKLNKLAGQMASILTSPFHPLICKLTFADLFLDVCVFCPEFLEFDPSLFLNHLLKRSQFSLTKLLQSNTASPELMKSPPGSIQILNQNHIQINYSNLIHSLIIIFESISNIKSLQGRYIKKKVEKGIKDDPSIIDKRDSLEVLFSKLKSRALEGIKNLMDVEISAVQAKRGPIFKIKQILLNYLKSITEGEDIGDEDNSSKLMNESSTNGGGRDSIGGGIRGKQMVDRVREIEEKLTKSILDLKLNKHDKFKESSSYLAWKRYTEQLIYMDLVFEPHSRLFFGGFFSPKLEHQIKKYTSSHHVDTQIKPKTMFEDAEYFYQETIPEIAGSQNLIKFDLEILFNKISQSGCLMVTLQSNSDLYIEKISITIDSLNIALLGDRKRQMDSIAPRSSRKIAFYISNTCNTGKEIYFTYRIEDQKHLQSENQQIQIRMVDKRQQSSIKQGVAEVSSFSFSCKLETINFLLPIRLDMISPGSLEGFVSRFPCSRRLRVELGMSVDDYLANLSGKLGVRFYLYVPSKVGHSSVIKTGNNRVSSHVRLLEEKKMNGNTEFRYSVVFGVSTFDGKWMVFQYIRSSIKATITTYLVS